MLANALPVYLTSKLDDLLFGAPNPRFAIAFSGGGDSTALLHALARHTHCAAVFIVDHGLRSKSAKEAELAKTCAEAFGHAAEILTWKPGRVTTGLQEKARKARYALMGQACRDDNIPFLVTGHTRDDQAETLHMRYERGTDWRGAAGMGESTFAPLWPELAGVTVLRPTLDVSRWDLRRYNHDYSLEWIEDPSNQNTDFKRIETRLHLKSRGQLLDDLVSVAADLKQGRDIERAHLSATTKDAVSYGEMSDLRLSRFVPSQLLSLCLQAVAGSGEPIRSGALERLSTSMREPDFRGATLAGVQIMPSDSGHHIFRDAGAVLGRNDKSRVPDMPVGGTPTLWDGRFWIESRLKDARAVPFWPNRDLLTPEQKSNMFATEVAVRKTVPAVLIKDKIVAVAGVLKHPDAHIIPAVQAHLQGRLSGG